MKKEDLLKYKMNFKLAAVVIVVLLLIAISLGFWAKSKVDAEFKQTGIKRTALEYLVDNTANLISKATTGKQTEKTQQIEQKKETVAKISGKEEQITKSATVIKADLINKSTENRGDFLLTKNEGFDITYVKTPDVFIVTLKKLPVELQKTAVEDWFIAQGFKKEDLCALGINYVVDFAIKSAVDFSTFKTHPANCY